MPHSIPMPTTIVRILKTLVILLLPLVLVMGAVRLLVTDQYLAFEYGKADFPPDPFGFSQTQRITYASSNFEYVREDQPLEALADQQLDSTPLYNARELKHMQDVQAVYQAAGWVWQIALNVILLAGFALAWRSETRPALAAAIRWGGLLTAGLISLIGLSAVLAWQLWFIAFHQIFFAAGTWTFNQWDTLIRLFPEKFWFDAALTISSLSLLGGGLLALLGWRWQMRRPVIAASPQLSTSPKPSLSGSGSDNS